MASSLHKLLSEEGFQRHKSRKPNNKKVKFKEEDSSITLPIYICHDRRSFDSSKQRALSSKASSVFSSRREGSGSERSNKNTNTKSDEPAIDEVAIRAMVSILSGYIGQYLKHKSFRRGIREKCRSCFERRTNKSPKNNEVFAHMEIGIQSIETLVEEDSHHDMDLESLQKSIKILSIVAEINDSSCRNLSACAHLYLSIVYKIAKNDKISARHLLQVFSDSPFLARTYLLPELWEHFFLPHLLHLKIWYNKELDYLAGSGFSDKEKRIKGLNRQYNDQMDNGTMQFAQYYKEWLKVGAQAPPIPSVPLPSKPTYPRSRRKSADSSTSHDVVVNPSLYRAVFGPVAEDRSMELEEHIKHCSHVEKKAVAHRRHSSSQSYRTEKAEVWPDGQKSDYFGFLGCRSEPTDSLVQRSYISSNEKSHLFELDEITRAIATICSSESLSDCENAVRALSEAWLNSNRDGVIRSSLSQASVIQGIMEVLFVSKDDEILELAISILAELATKNEINRRCVLNSDPQLDVSIRLLRSSSLFLKAATLLYLVKPEAKQMVSMEWVPLVLRVLEFGDQSQTLFTVRCAPHEAAYYFLDQLLTGFDEDKNVENARQIISLGGLGLLVRRMEVGDTVEKSRAVSVLYYCILADGSCRHYLARNVKTSTLISLLVLGKQTRIALALLTELLLLSRRKQRVEWLNELKKGWDCLNTMHILLCLLRRARLEERPVTAVILLQLDLAGDHHLEYSVYREESIDALVEALDCRVFDDKIQEAAARALLILGGHFSYTGEPEIERWLQRKAGLDARKTSNEEDRNAEIWQRKAAIALVSSGNGRLLAALSDSIANGIPRLARASLVTLCWMSSGLKSLDDRELRLAACSIVVPQLLECLKDNNNDLEEKILASLSLHSLTMGTDYFSRRPQSSKEVLDCLRELTRVTWTATDLISVSTNSLTNQFP